MPTAKFKITNGVLVEFKGNAGNVKIPEGVTRIGYKAFDGKVNIYRVDIPAGVVAIEESAFHGCSFLTALTLGPDVAEIGAHAFYGCDRLIEICNQSALPLEADSRTFGDVARRAKHIFAESDGWRQYMSGDCVLYPDDDGLSVVSCDRLAQDITIPDGVMRIRPYAFSFVAAHRVVIPDSVRLIGAYAFWSSKLTRLTIPDSVQDIGRNAFAECNRLVELEVPQEFASQVARIFPDSPVAAGALFNTLPTDARRTFALRWIAGVRNRYDDVAAIEEYLREKKVRLLVEALRMKAPDILKGLLEYYDTPYELYDVDEALLHVDEDAELRAILMNYKHQWYEKPEFEFSTLEELEKELGFRDRDLADWQEIFEVFPVDGGYMLGKYLMDEPCVEVPGRIEGLPVMTLQDTFARNHFVTSVSVEEGVVEIGPNAFAGCSGLRDVNLPVGLRIVGDNAFRECVKLTKISLPAGVQTIDSYAFSGCIMLSSVEVADGLTAIGYRAFANDMLLTSIRLPADVTSIDDNAFLGCYALTIRAPAGSYAEAFARRRGYAFEPET